MMQERVAAAGDACAHPPAADKKHSKGKRARTHPPAADRKHAQGKRARADSGFRTTCAKAPAANDDTDTFDFDEGSSADAGGREGGRDREESIVGTPHLSLESLFLLCRLFQRRSSEEPPGRQFYPTLE